MDERIVKIAKHYGIESQLEMVIEECSELIMAIQKCKRGQSDIENLIEETADVTIMTEQLKYFLGSKNVEEAREEKLQRQMQRMADEQKTERWIK